MYINVEVKKLNNELVLELPNKLIKDYRIKEKDYIDVFVETPLRYVGKCKCEEPIYSTHDFKHKCKFCGVVVKYSLLGINE